MKGTYHGGNKHKEEFSIEEFTLQIKRKAMGFTSAGLAIFIMTFSYYVIGMEDNQAGKTDKQQALSQERADTSEDTNTSDQFAITDKSSQSEATNVEKAAETSENVNSPTGSSLSSNKSPSKANLSDIVAIVEPSEELPVFEKEKNPPDNEKQEKRKSCFKWRHPGFLEKLDPCKYKEPNRIPKHHPKKIIQKLIPQNQMTDQLELLPEAVLQPKIADS